MLPAPYRMRRSEEFVRTVRRGRRAGRPSLVVHLLPSSAAKDSRASDDQVPHIGLVVSRAVGAAVTRTQVKRRLRHQLASRVTRLPAGSRLVVRATPAAAGATSIDLGEDLDRALDRVLDHRAGPRSPSRRVEGSDAGAVT